MDKKQITIRMPKERLENWLKALRSGEYKQGFAALRQLDHVTEQPVYCCLGVEMVCNGETNQNYLSSGTPPWDYLITHEIQYLAKDEIITYRDPFLPTLNLLASRANDSKLYNFNQIADAIEACAEGFLDERCNPHKTNPC